jgi:hypothetical protein
MVSKTTQHQYDSCMNKLFTFISESELSKPLKIYVLINKQISKNPSTVKTYISAIINYIKSNKLTINTDNYSKFIKNLSTTITNEREQNKMSTDDRKNYIKYEDIIKLRDSLKDKLNNNDIYKFYVILSLYTYIPPRRLLDYVIKKSNTDDDKNNIYNGKSLIFNNYKTKKIYDKQVIAVPKTLKSILDKYIKFNNIKDDDYILFDSANKLGRYLNTMFIKHVNKSVTLNSIRHSYINFINDNKSMTVSDRKKIAASMGHSVMESLLYIQK